MFLVHAVNDGVFLCDPCQGRVTPTTTTSPSTTTTSTTQGRSGTKTPIVVVAENR